MLVPASTMHAASPRAQIICPVSWVSASMFFLQVAGLAEGPRDATAARG